ncbi:MAG: hypothetical protein LUE19_09890, partial [Clostridiales bacterium]|nr:hypothetical protein [Clostridiales bacterium]
DSGSTDDSGSGDDGGSTDDADTTSDSVAYVADVDAWTTHGDPVLDELTGTDTQVLHLELTFSQAVSVTDEDGLKDEIKTDLTFGGASILTQETVSLNEASLSEDQKTLTVTVEGWYAAYSGLVVNTETWENLTAVNGDSSTDPTFSFFVPNGVQTATTEQVIADEDQNASVTTQIITDENCTRSMVHLLLLVNGQPVQLTSFGATATGHYHNYLTLTSAEFASLAAGYLNNAIGGEDGDYTITYEEDSDEVTITANSSEPGDILELHVMSYLNNGTKSINTSELETELVAADTVEEADYTAKSYAAYADALAKAQLAAADTTWYAQTDIDTLTEQLTEAREGLVLLSDDTGEEGNQQDSDISTATADTLAVRRGNTFYISCSNENTQADLVFTYGRSTDEVLIGDWDGDG